MSLETTVRIAASPQDPPETRRSARFKLHLGLVFLDGKKLKPLRALESARFVDLEAQLKWRDNPVMHLEFRDSSELATFEAAVASSRQRASELKSPGIPASPTSSRPSLRAEAHGPTPKTERRPAHALSPGPPAKKARMSAVGRGGPPRAATKPAGKNEAEEPDLTPVVPRLDLELDTAEREQRRKVAAQMAAARAEASQQRGIGDVAYAERLRTRAEREELLGRIQASCAMRKQEVPINLFAASVEDLRAFLAGRAPGLVC